MTNTPTDYRALCAELANHLQGRKELECGWGEEDPEQDLLDRARAALAQPEPEGPTDRELTDTFYGNCRDTVTGLRAVLARWGRPAIEPVPVEERLPGPEDCDAEGKCWWFGDLTRGHKHWFYASGGGQWTQHWLPYWAISTPPAGARP